MLSKQMDDKFIKAVISNNVDKVKLLLINPEVNPAAANNYAIRGPRNMVM